jgi:hypothetical protein
MASRIFPGNSVTSFPPTKELVNSFTIENHTGATETGSWTIPFGVRKIFVTMIGQGGGYGAASATATNNCCATTTIQEVGGANGSNTTITVNGTTYTALGGLKGKDSSVTATSDTDSFGGTSATQSSVAGPNNSQRDGSGNFFLGAGNHDGYIVTATVSTSDGAVTKSVDKNQSGLNGQTVDHSIDVTPGSTLTYSVPGQGGSTVGGGGALYITW